jgi:hypothetical protein
MRAAPDCRPPQTVWHVSQPRSSSTSHPPQQQDAVHREMLPSTGKGARAGTGPLLFVTLQAAGPAPAADRPAATAPHDTSPTNNNRPEEMRTSCRQQQAPPPQRCHHVSASAQSPSWLPMPSPRLQRAATARREKVQLHIREQSFRRGWCEEWARRG